MRRLRPLQLTLVLAVLAVLAVIAVAPLATGCEYVLYDLDSLQFRTSLDSGDDPRDAGDAGPDADADGDVGDVGEPLDTGDDVGDGGTDAGDVGPDADTGPVVSTCTRSFPLDPEDCNPVEETGCSGNSPRCDIRIEAGAPVIGCVSASAGTKVAGEACTGASECRSGLSCVTWSVEPDPRTRVCTTFCELETGNGCEADEFCTRAVSLVAVNMPGLGFCTPRCDPYDPFACDTGQTCSPDYQYRPHTCLPEFRCIRSAAPGVAEGDACVSNDSARMCQRGLACLDGTCVKPCGSSADCDQGTCGSPETDFRLRYCQ